MDTLLQKALIYKPLAIVLMSLIGWPLISAILNVMLRKKTSEEWEAWAMSKPALALTVELLRALGVDTKKAVVAFQRYAQRKSGSIPEGAVAAATPSLPPSVAALLSDPEKLKLLEQAAQKLASNATVVDNGSGVADDQVAKSDESR